MHTLYASASHNNEELDIVSVVVYSFAIYLQTIDPWSFLMDIEMIPNS
jgi:hypothetical protein